MHESKRIKLRWPVGFRFGKKIYSEKFGYSFIKNDIIYMYLTLIYKNPIILSLFEIAMLNFTMYISTILKCSLKVMYVIRRHKIQSSWNPISMNIFFTIKIFEMEILFLNK